MVCHSVIFHLNDISSRNIKTEKWFAKRNQLVFIKSKEIPSILSNNNKKVYMDNAMSSNLIPFRH